MFKRRNSAGRTRKAAEARTGHTDDDPATVFATFGSVMLIWQIAEQHLGELWVLSTIGEHQMATKRNLEKGLRRSIHAATKAAANETLPKLRNRIGDDLADELEAAMKMRDVLAHRYLRERMRGNIVTGQFMEGTAEELRELHDWFASLTFRLEALVVAEEEAVAAELVDLDVDTVTALDRVGRALLRNEPLDGPGDGEG